MYQKANVKVQILKYYGQFGSILEDFLIFKPYIHPFLYYLPFEAEFALNLSKLENPSPRDALCQVRLKFQRTYLKHLTLFSLFPYYLLFEGKLVLNLNNIENPFPKDALC